MTYTFTIPLAPEGAPRHRTGRTPDGRPVQYAHPKGVQWRLAVATCASQALAGVRLEGPLLVDIVAVFPRPKYLLKLHGRGPLKGTLVHGAGRIWHDKKPDRDNVDKGILDGLKAYWGDDCQVCCGEVLKVYAALDELPHVEVRISEAPMLEAHFEAAGFRLPYRAFVMNPVGAPDYVQVNGWLPGTEVLAGVPGVVAGTEAGRTRERHD